MQTRAGAHPAGRGRGARGAARAHRRVRGGRRGLLLRRHAGLSGSHQRRARPRRRRRLLRRPGRVALRRPVTAGRRRADALPRPRALRRRRRGDPPCRWSSTSSARLGEAGVDHDIVIYPGAPHSFFDRRQEQYAEASEDAGAGCWRSWHASRRRREQRRLPAEAYVEGGASRATPGPRRRARARSARTARARCAGGGANPEQPSPSLPPASTAGSSIARRAHRHRPVRIGARVSLVAMPMTGTPCGARVRCRR